MRTTRRPGDRRRGLPTKPSSTNRRPHLHKQEAGNIEPAERVLLNEFLAAAAAWASSRRHRLARSRLFRTVVGGSWRNGTTRWLEGPMHLYFADRQSPSRTAPPLGDGRRDYTTWTSGGADSRRGIHSEIGGRAQCGFQRRADALTTGSKRVSIYDIQPQMWTYENTAQGGRTPYRAFVSIPGHLYENFNRVNYRTILLRGIAWAGRRVNVDELVKKEELGDALRYVDGGPTHPMKAAAALEVHPEFDLSLVAAEPLIAKAMNLDWDERGRLWVSETPEYPNGRKVSYTARGGQRLARAGTAGARSETRSDSHRTNGDGVMDRKHVFADKLELVTGFVFPKNGSSPRRLPTSGISRHHATR